jgi:hypothetical protein
MSTTKTKTIQRKIAICAKCKNCPLNVRVVPASCEWMLKHVLSTEEERTVINRARRSGKTTEVIRRAMEMDDAGYDVVILVPNHQMAMTLQRKMMGSGVKILTARDRSQVAQSIAGLNKSLVFSDEVGEWIADAVDRDTNHEFMLGYQTKTT